VVAAFDVPLGHLALDDDPRTVLRSRSPDLVLQEIWGHLCCHYAIRSLMAEAATHSGHDPDRVSFVAALRITRQTIAHPGAFPPGQHARDSPGWLVFLHRLLGRLNPVRRPRTAPRRVGGSSTRRRPAIWGDQQVALVRFEQVEAAVVVGIVAVELGDEGP
jgi:hypothetical protein